MEAFVAPGVQKKMHAHPIYQWLRRELSSVLELATGDPLLEIGIVKLLLRHMPIYFKETERPSTTRTRPDSNKKPTHPERKRRAAERHVDLVRGYLKDGTIELAEVDQGALEHLLALARVQLAHQPRLDPEPVQLQLLRAFQYELGIELDAKSLAKIADALARGANVADSGGDRHRTALRYVKKARET
jgi:hypothetical protein